MFKIIERKQIVPNLHLLTIHSPDVAEEIQPGQFIILRSDNEAERIPLSVADWDREEGTVTIIFMVVGDSTGKLAAMNSGDSIPTFVGPLGKPTDIEKFGTVACVAGCYGIGSIFPIVRALSEKGNDCKVIIEGRSSYLIYWEEKLKEYSSDLMVITRDGSKGYKGHIKRIKDIFKEKSIKPDRIIVNGCTFLLSFTSSELRSYDVPILVNLNPIMIDGTGMCGVCRLTVDGKIKFACVDGPDFDGRLVDWDEFLQRRKQYIDEEAFLVHHSGCGGV